MKNKSTAYVAQAAMIAAIYVVLTVVFARRDPLLRSPRHAALLRAEAGEFQILQKTIKEGLPH